MVRNIEFRTFGGWWGSLKNPNLPEHAMEAVMSNLRFLWVVGLVGLLGCMRSFETGVTAYARPDTSHLKRFVLQGPEPGQVGGDPRWPVFSAMLTRALVAKGYVPDMKAPELLIRVTYRVGDTQTYTYTDTTTNADGTPGPSSSGSVETSSYVIRLEALDPATAGARTPVVLWRTHAEMRSTTTDLADVFPYLVASMEAYFGQTAAESRTIIKGENDPEAKRLRYP